LSTTSDPAVDGGRLRPVAVAYLLSQYPMLSMIFVIREVLQLRGLGFQIDVASINTPDRPNRELTADESGEAARTHYILAQGAAGALAAHAAALFSRPAGYLRGWAEVLRLGRLDLHRLGMLAAYLTEALMVGRWMRRIGRNHLHVHLGSQAATVGLLAKRVFGFGFSMTVHGPDEFYDVRGQFLSEKIVAADFIFCISHFARSQLMKLSPYGCWEKLHVSRLGVDPDVFAPRAPGRDAGAPFEVLCVGRLTPAKGQHVLIDAMKLLKDQGRAVRLRIVGEGPDGTSLRAQAGRLNLGDTITFEGAVNQDRIRVFYSQADCFCLPSFAEGIPVVLMEAMAMGIPCVTTHITGIPELITHRETGLLTAPADVTGLAANIAALMDEPDLAVRISGAGRAKVVADYDLARNTQVLAALFGGLT
jgi:glycosyltransferase involved in cell wall biosynthesis